MVSDRRREVAEGLRDLLSVVNSGRPLAGILDEVLAQAGRLLGSDGGAVYLRDPDDPALLSVHASRGLEPSQLALKVRTGSPVTGLAVLQRRPVACGRPGRRVSDLGGAVEELALDVLPGFDPTAEVAGPGGEPVRPRLDRVDVARVLAEPKGAGPPVVVEVPHRHLVPRAVRALSVAERGGQDVLPLPQDVGPDGHGIADFPLDRVAAVVQLGIDRLDEDAGAGVHRQRSTKSALACSNAWA
jgi:hypothetical protein